MIVNELIQAMSVSLHELIETGELPEFDVPSNLDGETRLFDFALDSLGKTTLLLAVESKLDRTIPLWLLAEDSTINDIASLILNYKADASAVGDVQEQVSRLSVSKDTEEITLRFNVMPDRYVEERLNVSEYQLSKHSVVAKFSRIYRSEMKQSPDHLVMLTFQAQSQKLLYVYLCHHFDIPYDSTGVERFKIWPVQISVNLPELVTQRDNLEQKLVIESMNQSAENSDKFEVIASSNVGSMSMTATSVVYKL
jgi:acyl carrier protein